MIPGSVPEAIKIDNSFMPAKASTTINYQLNLPQLPKTASYDATVPGSELMKSYSYGNSGAANATATGTLDMTAGGPASTYVADGDTLTIKIGANTLTYTFSDTPSGPNDIDRSLPIANAIADIETKLRASGVAGTSNASVSIVGGMLAVSTANNDYTNSLTVGGTAPFGMPVPAQNPNVGVLPDRIQSGDTDKFISESIAGGGLTLYSPTGQPVNVQMRWAKTSDTPGAESWALYYGTGDAAPADSWVKAGSYTFNQGVLAGLTAAPGATEVGMTGLTINPLTIGGTALGAITIDNGAKGITQFADNAGSATTTELKQNGYGAGQFISVGVSDTGRIVASYTNGETKEVAQILVATFNAPNALKRGDGGVFSATQQSGEPILSMDGGIVGSSLEASNTDISEEFTKLIVTQQAYAANTRIVSAADSMLQETLNMMR